MKPSWKDAPSWASWLAQDEEGTWFWYEHKPFIDPLTSVWRSGTRHEQAWINEWEKMLEERPA